VKRQAVIRSEAVKRGWTTRRRREEREAQERVRVAAMHFDEHERAWARMPEKARETAIERGWGQSLPPDELARITGHKP
jgi:hypothetical protein